MPHARAAGIVCLASVFAAEAADGVKYFPTDPHDCREGLATWWQSWDADKRAWCCANRLRCPKLSTALLSPVDSASPDTEAATKAATEAATEAVTTTVSDTTSAQSNSSGRSSSTSYSAASSSAATTSASPTASTTKEVEHRASDPFNCQTDLATWWQSWDVDKREWCCAHRLHCPRLPSDFTPPPARFDCHEGLGTWWKNWDADQREYCCNHRVSCPAAPTSPSRHEGPGTTRMPAAGYSCEGDAQRWGEAELEYCCFVFGRGCEDGKRRTTSLPPMVRA